MEGSLGLCFFMGSETEQGEYEVKGGESKLQKRFEGFNLRDNLVQNQTLQIMSKQDVRESLFETNLNFDSGMANEVFVFLTQSGIESDKRNIYLQAVAAAAIIQETKVESCKGIKQSSRQGITIETIMNHLNGYSKEQFIETLQYIISKNSSLNQKLSSKIQHLNLSYRLFKKYRKSFLDLWQHTGIYSLVMNDLLSIFWIIYLLVKVEKVDIFEDFSKQVKLIIVLIKSVFEYCVSCVPQSIVNATIEDNFSIKISNSVDEQFFLLHHLQLVNQAQKIYSIRYQKQTIDFKRFSKNPIQIARFLDDISNYFYQERQYFKIEHYIDQISYLELKKVLAPLKIQKQIQSDLPIIKSSVEFLSQQKHSKSQDKKQNENLPSIPVLKQTNHFIITQNLSQMTPLRDRKNDLGITPCQNRIINLQWIRNCLDYMRRSDANPTFSRVFNYVQKQALIDFQFKARKQLFYLVNQFTPKCLRKENRVNDMLAFFKYIIIKIYHDHNQAQNAQMFKEVKTFNAILCLSCDIFNFAYSSLMSSYRKVCEIFEVPLIEALKPINWIGKNVDKPSELNTYLYALEKRIVIKQIWEDQTGYNLLKSQQDFNQSSSIGYNDMIVWRRLIKHIFDRVEELSKEVKLEHKLTKRIQNSIETILKQKPFLLHKNKIDQIIICCMTSFLSINQIHQQKTLEKVFKDYNRMQLSFNSNREGLLGDGREMNLSQFYNQVFLPEIQDIVDKNLTQTDFLLTPIRQSYHQRFVINQGLITPFTKKYTENQIDGGQNFRPVELFNASGFKLQGLSFFKKQNTTISPQNYRTKLVLQYQKMQEEEREKNKDQSEKMSEKSDQSDEDAEYGQRSRESYKSIGEEKSSGSQQSLKSQKLSNSESESANSMSEEGKSKDKVEMIKQESEIIQNELSE